MSKDVAKRVMNWDGIDKEDKGKLLYFGSQFRKSADSMMASYLEASEMVAQANAILAKPGCKGKFVEYVEIELGISKQTAYNMVAVNRKFGGSNSTSVGLFTPSAMIALASSKLPDDVIEKAKEIAAGGKVTGSIAKQAKAAATLEIPMDHATVTETEVDDEEPITAPDDSDTEYEDVDPPEPTKTTTKATPKKPSPIDLVAQIQSAASRLDGMVKELKDLATQNGGAWLNFEMQQISDEAHALKYRIRNTVFWNVCPECDGKKCSHCKQLGWLSKSRKNFLTPNGKAKLGE